jgi:hypothetical protein
MCFHVGERICRHFIPFGFTYFSERASDGVKVLSLSRCWARRIAAERGWYDNCLVAWPLPEEYALSISQLKRPPCIQAFTGLPS